MWNSKQIQIIKTYIEKMISFVVLRGKGWGIVIWMTIQTSHYKINKYKEGDVQHYDYS